MYGLEVDCGSSNRGFDLESTKDVWIEDCDVSNGGRHLQTRNVTGIRFHDCTFTNSSGRVMHISSFCHHVACTDITVDDCDLRTYYIAGHYEDGHSWNVYVSDHTEVNKDDGEYALNVHWGNGQVDVEDVDMSDSSNDTNLFRNRSYSIRARGENVVRGSSRSTVQRDTQRTANLDVRNCTVLETGYGCINFKYHHDERETGPHEDLYYENIVVPADSGMFEFQTPLVEIDGLEIWNSNLAADPQNPQESELYEVDDFLAEDNNYDPDYHTNFLIQGEDPEDHL